ncbi:MAG: hypothetical protein JNN03_20235 [Rubrivivax sp.]|nr:hypothetical protein [Rubrivivax sp.]
MNLPNVAAAHHPGHPSHRLGRLALLAAAIAGIAMAACGGDDETAAPAAPGTSLAGTAAVGAPITGGKLRIVDAAGNVVAENVALGADGSFAGVELTGAGPWRLEACGYAGPNWTCVHSVAQQGGTANVTPLTSALVLLASGSSPEALMSGAAAGLDASAVAAAQGALRSGLGPVLASAGVDGDLDLVTGTLAAGSRAGYDRLLDAVQVNTGVDGQPFVQIGSRMGSGNLYLEQGAPAVGSLSAAAGAADLPLAGLETLFNRMSSAIASPGACAHAETGLASTLAADAALSLGGPSITGPANVAQALCTFLGGEAPEPARWGSRFMSPVLGKCDFAGAAPVCGVSFSLQDTEGGVESLGNGMAVTYTGGQWKFKGDRLPLAMHASARVQRDVRFDGTTPRVDYNRAIAFEIPAAAGLACARVSQRNAEGQLVTFAYFKRHTGGGIERLSLWTSNGQGNDRSLDPLAGTTRSSDDTWVMLPQGDDGDAAVRHFFRGGRSVVVDLYGNAACTADFQVAGTARYEVEVAGVPPVWSALPTLPWPDLATGTQTMLRNLTVAANTDTPIDVGWTFARGSMAVGEVIVCSDRSLCGQGNPGRIGEGRARPSARSAAVTLRSGVAVAAGANKSVALSGRNGDGLALEANFLSCPGTPAGQVCQDGDVQVMRAVGGAAKRR